MPVSRSRAKPLTYHVDVDQALETLDHDEMLALAGMFERWALTETRITGEHRTQLIQWSVDYEAIAAFAGPGWKATEEPGLVSLVQFIARGELSCRR